MNRNTYLSCLAALAGGLALTLTPWTLAGASSPTAPETAPASPGVQAAPAPGSNSTASVAAPSQNLATHLVLVLGERKVYAYQNDKVIASYPVAVGKKGWETPTGNFQVIQMTENPVWENPWNGKKVPASLNGPIGVRWIGFWSDGKNTIGFHGTPKKQEHLLGKAVSHGCVRMRNPDVVALFQLVQPGTPVIVKQKK
ncbi:MAG: L,D-transpeptidase family protein [Cyanobacteria bacterium RI_101]|nr:L,D-transpeptidase family protein [Cyanobacteria bacterium RI_101]